MLTDGSDTIVSLIDRCLTRRERVQRNRLWAGLTIAAFAIIIAVVILGHGSIHGTVQ